MIRPHRRPSLLVVCALGSVLLLGSVVLAVTFGPADIGIIQAWRILLERAGGPSAGSPPLQTAMVADLRLPRCLLAAADGAGLALCGAVLQSMLRNPLADPYLLGVASGATTGAVIILVLGVAGAVGLSGGALVGALVAFALMLLLSRLAGGTTASVVLAGVAITQGFSALTSFIVMVGADANTTRGVLFWLMGSLGTASWNDVAVVSAVVCGGVLLCLASSSSLDAFAFGETAAAGLGVRVRRVRVVLLVTCALVTAAVVATSGAIGFVGLVMPHIGRALVGPRHRLLLPTSALLGAVFLVWADTAARAAFSPLELPVGVMTSLVGVPVFALVLVNRRRLA